MSACIDAHGRVQCMRAQTRTCMSGNADTHRPARSCKYRARRTLHPHTHPRPPASPHAYANAHKSMHTRHLPPRTRTTRPHAMPAPCHHMRACIPARHARAMQTRCVQQAITCTRHAHTMRTTTDHVHTPCAHDAQNKQSSAHAVRGRSSSCMHACIAVQYAACAADANILAPAFTSASAFTPASA